MADEKMKGWTQMNYILSFLVCLLIAAAPLHDAQAKKTSRKSSSVKSSRKKPGSDLARLGQWMTGYFSSQQQAAKDSDYFDVRLRMTPIWKQRSDGRWLYIEQAMAEHQERPYRQRVYCLTQLNDTTFESRVYAFTGDPTRFVGEWKKPLPLAELIPDSLIHRDGCSIILYKKGEIAFVGGTIGKNCASDLRGAAYATSEVTISKNQLISWDRGYDEEGNQSWGARKGGYVFKKIEGY